MCLVARAERAKSPHFRIRTSPPFAPHFMEASVTSCTPQPSDSKRRREGHEKLPVVPVSLTSGTWQAPGTTSLLPPCRLFHYIAPRCQTLILRAHTLLLLKCLSQAAREADTQQLVQTLANLSTLKTYLNSGPCLQCDPLFSAQGVLSHPSMHRSALLCDNTP